MRRRRRGGGQTTDDRGQTSSSSAILSACCCQSRRELASDLCRPSAVFRPPASRKEVIQPQVPLRLPCYDFTPVADLTVVGYLLLRGWPAALR
jgi:hypothetical protein